jgi:hypothetical protein
MNIEHINEYNCYILTNDDNYIIIDENKLEDLQKHEWLINDNKFYNKELGFMIDYLLDMTDKYEIKYINNKINDYRMKNIYKIKKNNYIIKKELMERGINENYSNIEYYLKTKNHNEFFRVNLLKYHKHIDTYINTPKHRCLSINFKFECAKKILKQMFDDGMSSTEHNSYINKLWNKYFSHYLLINECVDEYTSILKISKLNKLDNDKLDNDKLDNNKLDNNKLDNDKLDNDKYDNNNITININDIVIKTDILTSLENKLLEHLTVFYKEKNNMIYTNLQNITNVPIESDILINIDDIVLNLTKGNIVSRNLKYIYFIKRKNVYIYIYRFQYNNRKYYKEVKHCDGNYDELLQRYNQIKYEFKKVIVDDGIEYDNMEYLTYDHNLITTTNLELDDNTYKTNIILNMLKFNENRNKWILNRKNPFNKEELMNVYSTSSKFIDKKWKFEEIKDKINKKKYDKIPILEVNIEYKNNFNKRNSNKLN